MASRKQTARRTGGMPYVNLNRSSRIRLMHGTPSTPNIPPAANNTAQSSTMSKATSTVQQQLSHLETMYLEEQTADVHFVVGIGIRGSVTERIPAHKILLVAGSTVFRTMFFGSLPEKGDIVIPDSTPNAFKKFLKWFYYNNHVLTMDSIAGVLYLAKKYDVDTCLNDCTTFLGANMEKDILLAHNLAVTYDLANVKANVEKMMDPSSTFYTSDAFLQCPRPTLKKIVQFPFIEAKRKFELCMLWSESGCKRLKQDPKHMKYRRELLGDCLDHIDFSAMSAKEFHDCIEHTSGLFKYSEMQKLLLGLAKKHM